MSRFPRSLYLFSREEKTLAKSRTHIFHLHFSFILISLIHLSKFSPSHSGTPLGQNALVFFAKHCSGLSRLAQQSFLTIFFKPSALSNVTFSLPTSLPHIPRSVFRAWTSRKNGWKSFFTACGTPNGVIFLFILPLSIFANEKNELGKLVRENRALSKRFVIIICVVVLLLSYSSVHLFNNAEYGEGQRRIHSENDLIESTKFLLVQPWNMVIMTTKYLVDPSKF